MNQLKAKKLRRKFEEEAERQGVIEGAYEKTSMYKTLPGDRYIYTGDRVFHPYKNAWRKFKKFLTK